MTGVQTCALPISFHEGGLASRLDCPADDISGYDLDESSLLREWLANNRDIIPVELGGEAEPCRCGEAENPWSRHVPRCPYQWYNKNASRWFRKVVSLESAANCPEAEALVWVDSDCRFKSTLPSSIWADLFEGASVLYHKSRHRKVIESGVIAFKMDAGGRCLLSDVVDRYLSGRFRRDLRWDDGFQFQQAIKEHPAIRCIDLASASDSGYNVLPSSPLGRYIDHHKGTHGAVLHLMR